MNNNIKKVVIAGGGSAGWMAAAALSKLFGKNLDITLIDSEEIGRIGVGESTMTAIGVFNQLLGITEQEFMSSCQCTFKLGIEFKDWGQKGDSYIHAFGLTGKENWLVEFQHYWLASQKQGFTDRYEDYCTESKAARARKFAISEQHYPLNYAYHIDAGLYAEFLKKFSMAWGVKHLDGVITDVNLNGESGHIESLTLRDGRLIEGELFLDCTGLKALLIEGALKSGFDSYADLIPCDSAIPVQTEAVANPRPYTQAMANDFGWQWRIPLQSRVGNGIVYCSEFVSDDDALSTLMSNLESPTITETRVLKYNTGRRNNDWVKNCVAIGLSSGFLEPVESTAIHLVMRSILRLMEFFPHKEIMPSIVDEYNKQTKDYMEGIRDFIILHYKATEREDTPFWKYCKNMDIPDSLANKIQLYKESGVCVVNETELFSSGSWSQVLLGQRVIPDVYHRHVDDMTTIELRKFLKGIKNKVNENVSIMPSQQSFIDSYCKFKGM